MNTFENLNLSEQLKESINRLGFTEPTQIQRESIPLILKGKDVIGESATGSGKTLAFGAGIIKNCNPDGGIQAIVLVPTRELAEQVKDEMIKISYNKPIKILAVYGGVSINPQIEKLRKTEVVIATPGRLLDHLNRHTINTSKVKIMVLDEADRMVEMGFIEDVERIIKSCPKDRQTLVFSATIYGPTKRIAQKYMKNPETIEATKMVDPSKLKQTYYDVPPKLKKELLVHLLKKEDSDLVMVFCNTRRITDIVDRVLKANGIKSATIHGGLNQSKRLKTIELFHKGKFRVLVCTDVAARGLHIEGVTHIYNFDIPKEPGDYVHRIGRTARAGKKGLVINILSSNDYKLFSRLKMAYGEFDIQKEERPYLTPITKSEKNYSRGKGNFRKGYRRKNTNKYGRSSSRNNTNRHGKSSSKNPRFKSRRNFKRKYN
ncbi:DEAD/DEAH box helicase [Candidatus Woesearchaeota archaeon]|nr:DEAD/DEAH box helicase [Candidatus Woesearchaeota archaeon]